jgi:hypothetical protein
MLIAYTKPAVSHPPSGQQNGFDFITKALRIAAAVHFTETTRKAMTAASSPF